MAEERIKRCKASVEHLTDEFVAFEILTWLPVRSLLRFRSVSKSWRALISDPSFVAAHLDRSRQRPRLLVTAIEHHAPQEIAFYSHDKSDQMDNATFLFGHRLPDNQTVLCPPQHCNGLMLLITMTRLLVFNPSTRESMTLPEGSRNRIIWWKGSINFDAGFGLIQSTNTCKVVRYFYRSCDFKGKTSSIGFEVFTVGTDSSWRATAEDPPYPISYAQPQSVGGFIYFAVFKSLHSSSPKALLSFDLKDEKFHVVDPPAHLGADDFENMRIVDWEGKPCLVHRSKDGKKFDLWTSKDCNDHAWVPKFSFNLLQPQIIALPIAELFGKIFFMGCGKCRSVAYYDPQHKSFEPVVIISKKGLVFYNQRKRGRRILRGKANLQVTPYVESLIAFAPRR